MVPYGIDLNSIPKEDSDSKVLIPVSDALPLAAIPPKPRSYGQSYFAQPVLTTPPQPLLLEDAQLKGPAVKLPAGTKLLPPKHNETLVGVKTNKSGEIICAKYSTGDCTYFEGVCLAKSSSSRRRTLLNTPLLLLKLLASVVGL
jgi:hypothetical protein